MQPRRVTKNGLSTIASIAALAAMGLVPRVAAAQSYTFSQTSRAFSSISATGTSLGLTGADDSAASFSSPFGFSFFGATISSGTSLYASTNGTLSVGVTFSGYSNTTFPAPGAPSGFMAPFWTDLRFGSVGDVYYQSTASELVVEWAGVESYSASGETISFQIRIGSDGTVRYVYGPNTALATWGATSIGLEDATDTYGASAPCTPSCLPSNVPSGTEFVFTPGAAPAGPDLSFIGATPPAGSTLMAGQTISIPFEVQNTGSQASGATRVGLFAGLTSPVSPSDAELGSTTIPSISGGGSHVGNLSFTIPTGVPPATVTAGLIVDPDGLIMEGSETNNSYTLGTYTLGGGGGDSIVITTSELPRGTVGIPYDVQLNQTGGTDPSWFLLEGSLPSGVNLSGTGRLSGTPAQTGSYSFTVEATETGLSSGVATLTLTVDNGGTGNITVSPTSLPDASVGAPYSTALQASGGTPPYAFQVISGRPDWMQVSSDGQITGTPTGPGDHMMTVSVFDSDLADGTAVIGLRVIQSGPIQIVTQIPAAVSGRPYSQQVVQGGIPPYQINIVDGTLPGDMRVDQSGVMSGTPDRAGRFQLTMQISDSDTPTGTAAGQVVLQVTELRPLEITMPEVIITLRTDVEIPLDVQGGVPPYTWSIVAGTLPGSVQLDPAGKLVGRIETAQTSTVTFSVSDSEGSRAERAIPVIGRGYRNTDPGAGRAGRSNSGGCVCVKTPGATPGWAWLGVFLGLGGVVRRRRRHSMLGDGSYARPPAVTTARGR